MRWATSCAIVSPRGDNTMCISPSPMVDTKLTSHYRKAIVLKILYEKATNNSSSVISLMYDTAFVTD